MNYLEYYTIGQETAFLKKISDTCYKVGIISYGNTTHCSKTSSFNTLIEAHEAFVFYKNLVDNQ